MCSVWHCDSDSLTQPSYSHHMSFSVPWNIFFLSASACGIQSKRGSAELDHPGKELKIFIGRMWILINGCFFNFWHFYVPGVD